MIRIRRGRTLRLALLAFGLHFNGATARADPQGKPPVSQAVATGATAYYGYCAVCHGERGKGDGPAAGALTPRPTDLTRLTPRAGTFPAAHVTSVLKGTDPVVAHGTPAMMVWGPLFLADANGNQAAADARISALVQFIASIQKNK